MEDDLNYFNFVEKITNYEEQLHGVEFSLEQTPGKDEWSDIWILEIFDMKHEFDNLDSALEHLDKIIEERKSRG